MNDQQIEQALATKTGDRVRREDINERIDTVSYYVLPGTTVTICSITLDNGFSVRGESACVDPTNFDELIGRSIAYTKAFEQLWPLFGFLLAEKRLIRKEV